ncbi:hypothetical protein OSB04_025496 [Centaurea solstitialis]|uniref:Uncharacterized protein n=1 Tax=Centaurea solstitialis TaxID=347529 RepID=A0AA38SN72_9ASTR|nr:hypothetical protein OSB04_025496 [Centaurea solstitialis]
MAMHASRLTQDQNFSVHFDGVKANGSTVQKNKGGLRARKALNDISNSKNVIPIGEDLGVPKKAQIGGKPQISGKKTQVSGRKALGDLTNSVKPFGQQQDVSCRSVSARNTLPRKSMDEDPIMLFGMEEIPLPTIEERPRQYRGQSSPICGSPNSPRMTYMNDYDWGDFSSFILAESPRRSK